MRKIQELKKKIEKKILIYPKNIFMHSNKKDVIKTNIKL